MKVGIHNGSVSHKLLLELSKCPRKLPRSCEQRHPFTGRSLRSDLVRRGLIRKIDKNKRYEITDTARELLKLLSNPPCHKCKNRVDCFCSGETCTKGFMVTVEVKR